MSPKVFRTITVFLVFSFYSLPSLQAKDGKSFEVSLRSVSGQSAVANNALDIEKARDINNLLKGGLAFQSVPQYSQFSGVGALVSLSNESFVWGWTLSLDVAQLTGTEGQILTRDYFATSIQGDTFSTKSDSLLTLSSNRLNIGNVGYTADIYAFRSGGIALQKLGIRLGGRIRHDKAILGDSQTFTGSTLEVTGQSPVYLPMNLDYLNVQTINYYENALELQAGISYRYSVSSNFSLDAAFTGIVGTGLGNYVHNSTGIIQVKNLVMPAKANMEGDTKLTRSGFLGDVGLRYDINDRFGLRLSYQSLQVQSKVTNSSVKDPDSSPMLAMLGGDLLPYIIDHANPMGSNPANSNRLQTISLALHISF